LRIAAAMDDLKSSHAYFIIQKAYGEIDWNDAQKILDSVLADCNCKSCKKVKSEVSKRFS
jgi:hypothetical protein